VRTVTPIHIVCAALLAASVTVGSTASPFGEMPRDPGYGTYAWPVRGPVIRGFEPPPTPFASGHRGIDIGAPFGSDMVAAQDGVVAFAGWVGGSLFVSIDHDDGVRTTYSWLSGIAVVPGDSVILGQVIGQTGQGHPGSVTPHLHFGARVGTTYIDPMLLLQAGNVGGFIHLAPLGPGQGPWGDGRGYGRERGPPRARPPLQ
jgi:murein DD-endopeptidase MepM/ murein hydrolase activator NlpD